MADYEDFDPDDGGYERESPEVYRRRRIVAGIIAILLIGLVIWGLVFAYQKLTGGSTENTAQESSAAPGDNFASFSARPDPSASASASESGNPSDQPSDHASASPSDSAAPSESSSSSASESPKPSPTPTTQEPVKACSDGLTVTTAVDKGSYGAGQNPVITATAANTSGNPCTVDLGSANVSYKITSGPADVYDSTKCGPQDGHQEATLKPKGTQKATQTWDRGMNAFGCGKDAQPAQPGYYWVTATINGVASEPTAIVIQ